jgi:putative NIF3 family GTP cyclohydrolase 1 type 2
LSKIREIFRFQEDKTKNEIVFLYDLIFQKYYLKMILKEFTSELDKLFSLKQAEDFDNVGLLCGNPAREVSGVLVCHDALENVVDEAIAKNCNVIVTFHPIIFSGLKSITGKNYVERAVLKAIENKIAIYAIHTAFDNDYFGVNYRICNELGLKNQTEHKPPIAEDFLTLASE